MGLCLRYFIYLREYVSKYNNYLQLVVMQQSAVEKFACLVLGVSLAE